ncbi:MAG: hypothetical protein GC129_01870 [Proteobacteria bacterium]|nr:hypothetical protein [Pseudomonadota bacterium]
MKWGERYPAEYVNRLWRMVRRQVSGEVQMVCFTDDAKGVVKEVECRPLPAFEGVRADLAVKPWRKLSLWKADLGKDLTGRDALVLDLDVVVVGSLDAFWDFEPGKFVVWENPTKPGSGGGNTSVFRFKVGSHPEIYDYFMADPVGLYAREFRIEQEFISAVLGEPGVRARFMRKEKGGTRNEERGSEGLVGGLAALSSPADQKEPSVVLSMPAARKAMRWGQGEQRFWPRGWCLSFKEDLLPGWPMRFWRVAELPAGAKVVAFHGKPDPDEAMVGKWPAKGWKKLYKFVLPVGWIRENWG